MGVLQNKPTRSLIIIMVILVGVVLVFSKIYYTKENNHTDPRVKDARELYKKYNTLVAEGDYKKVLSLLDTIESIYNSYPHYQNSFETGVLYNNRSAIYLTSVLSYDSTTQHDRFFQISTDSLVKLAIENVNKSIQIYEEWLLKYDNKNTEQIDSIISDSFLLGLSESKKNENYLNTRIEEIQDAQEETKRRLSVSYTNLGIIYRFQQEYENAAQSYIKAIELWDRNLTAENNLNLLLGKPLKKRNFIQKLFPPNK